MDLKWYLVTGGFHWNDWNEYVQNRHSTEMWSCESERRCERSIVYNLDLASPEPLSGTEAVSLNNRIFLFGILKLHHYVEDFKHLTSQGTMIVRWVR